MYPCCQVPNVSLNYKLHKKVLPSSPSFLISRPCPVHDLDSPVNLLRLCLSKINGQGRNGPNDRHSIAHGMIDAAADAHWTLNGRGRDGTDSNHKVNITPRNPNTRAIDPRTPPVDPLETSLV
jgi:hypothetical protein